MHETEDPRNIPRAGAKKAPSPSVSETDMQRRIQVACAGERCWRCFRVLCECRPGFGLNGGTR